MPVVLLSTIILSMTAILQGTWFGSFSIFGAAPDLPMLVLMWISFHNAKSEGPVAGFLSGLVEDIISSSPFGFHAFSRTLVAWVVSAFHGSFHIDVIVMPVLFGIAGTILKTLTAYALSLLLGDGIFVLSPADAAFWIQCGLNGILAPAIFFFLTKMRRYLVTQDRKR